MALFGKQPRGVESTTEQAVTYVAGEDGSLFGKGSANAVGGETQPVSGEVYDISLVGEEVVLTDSQGLTSAADLSVLLAGKQERVDGVFFVSTAAQRGLNPPVGELALYSDINGTPVREHTQAMVVRGIRGVGTAFEVGDANGTIIYDEIEIVASGGGLDITPYDSNAEYELNDYVRDTDGVLHRFISTTLTNGLLINTAVWETIGGANQIGTATQSIGTEDEGSVPANTSGVRVSLGANNALLNVPNSSYDVYGIGGIGVTVEENRVIVDGSNIDVGTIPTFANTAAWEAQEHISTDIEYYISTSDSYDPTTANADLVAQGYTDGDEFFIVSRDTTYQVITTGGNFALQFILTNRDSLAVLNGGQGVLDNITTNVTNIEALTEHNHEQDARIAALETQDFSTTISSFTADATLSSFFTSGTITNKGTSSSNLYEAWDITREGHELIGYLQFTDTERDSFRNEFSLSQGSSSNIYIPANPDAPHTVGIKAFPAADFNDLSTDTQVILAQISSMRFNGARGSETSFEIRWQLINYSDAIDTGLGTVDSGEIYGAAGDKRYAFLAATLYNAPAWEFREATVSRTEVITTGTDNALRTAPATVADDTAWLAYINGLGISGEGGSIRVDGIEVENPNFIDNAISTGDARGVAFGADASGNIIGQVDTTGLGGMSSSDLEDNTAGSLVKVNTAKDGFDDAVDGVDYQGPLVAGTDYQTPLTVNVDYLAPDGTIQTSQVINLDTMLTALGVTDPSDISLFVDGKAYRIGDNFVEANTLYRVLSAGSYASFNAIIAANAAQAIGTFTINQTNNSFTSVTFTATVTDDSGTSVNLSNISYDTPTTTLTVEGTDDSSGTEVTSSLNVNVGAAARTAVSATAINLASTSTINNSLIITQELVDTAVGTGDFVIVDNVLQVNNGITSPGFVSFVRVNGFLGVKQEASDATRDIFVVTYRGATHTVYFFRADSTWRSSDSTTDNTNIITPLIGG